MPRVNYPREQMHRIRYTKLTESQIAEKLQRTKAGPVSASALSDALTGKSLKIVTDGGPVLSYTFSSVNKLRLSEGDGAAAESGYGALALEQLVVFSHMLPGAQRGYTVVADRKTNLTTVFEVWFSGYTDKREVQRQIYYG